LYLRALDTADAHPMVGTDGARLPFWSADSRSIGFFASGKLFRIDITGGPAQKLAAAAVPQGGTWNADGTILFTPNSVSPIFRVPASGGKAVPATEFASPRQNNHRQPSFLPDGRQFLFYAPGDSEVSGIFLGSLEGTSPKRLTAATSTAAFLRPEHIVYLQNGDLVARRFDAAKGELTGDPISLAASTADKDAINGFSISANGILAYRSGSSSPAHLTWLDRTGKVLERGEEVVGPDISPDGRALAFDRTIKGNRDVWILDLERGGLTPFTFHPQVDGYPIWSPDGTRIAFHSNRNGNFDIWIKPTNGAADTEQLLHGTPDNEWPLDWSNDGRFLLYARTDAYYVSSDLFALPMTGEKPKPVTIANTPFEEHMGQFSPDARWVAYNTDESGRAEIVVQAFPESYGTVHVSTNGGAAPRWSADGKEIYFIAPDGMMMAVDVVTSDSTLNPGKPVALFSTHMDNLIFRHQYAVSRDGRFLIMNREVDEASPITMLINWKPWYARAMIPVPVKEKICRTTKKRPIKRLRQLEPDLSDIVFFSGTYLIRIEADVDPLKNI
jgi:Tol biopolymer transport system component